MAYYPSESSYSLDAEENSPEEVAVSAAAKESELEERIIASGSCVGAKLRQRRLWCLLDNPSSSRLVRRRLMTGVGSARHSLRLPARGITFR